MKVPLAQKKSRLLKSQKNKNRNVVLLFAKRVSLPVISQLEGIPSFIFHLQKSADFSLVGLFKHEQSGNIMQYTSKHRFCDTTKATYQRKSLKPLILIPIRSHMFPKAVFRTAKFLNRYERNRLGRIQRIIAPSRFTQSVNRDDSPCVPYKAARMWCSFAVSEICSPFFLARTVLPYNPYEYLFFLSAG